MDNQKLEAAKSLGIKWKLSDKSGEPSVKLIKLSKINENSFMSNPKNNCRDLREIYIIKLMGNIKHTDMRDVIFVMKNEKTGLYDVADGNHLQQAIRRMGDRDIIRAHVMEGDASLDNDAKKMFCFSYIVNSKSMIGVEKMIALHLGRLYYGKQYREQLKNDFDESLRTISRYIGVYDKLSNLDSHDMDSLIEYFRDNETGIQTMEQMVDECIEKKKNKISDEKNQLERVEIIDRSLHNSIVKVNGTLNKLQLINFNHNINVVNKETARVKGMKEEQKKINQPHDVSFLKTKDSELSEEIKAAKHSIECANKHMEVMKQFTDSVREYIMLSNYEET